MFKFCRRVTPKKSQRCNNSTHSPEPNDPTLSKTKNTEKFRRVTDCDVQGKGCTKRPRLKSVRLPSENRPRAPTRTCRDEILRQNSGFDIRVPIAEVYSLKIMDFDTLQRFTDSWWPYVISFVISVVSAIRMYMAGPSCPSQNRMDGKIVLITGASSGIGFETAKELAQRGATIILACRNFEKGQKAMMKIKSVVNNPKIDLKILDVSCIGGVKKFVMLIELRYQKIDVLINNAGIIFHPYEKTEEGFELTLATNYLGAFALTLLLLPLLKKSDNGRIINLTAVAHYASRININDLNCERNFVERDVFGQSKLALIMFSIYLSGKLKDTRMTINAVNPGLVRNTNHLRNSPFGKSLITKISTYPWIWLFLKTPKQGCQTVVYAAVDPSLGNISGVYLSDCEMKEPADVARNECMAERLFKKSCEMCKIDGEEIFKKIIV